MTCAAPTLDLAGVRETLAALPDGVHHEDDPLAPWWVRAGNDRWMVRIVPGLISQRRPDWAALASYQVLVVDRRVWRIHGADIRAYLEHFAVRFDVIEVPSGEACKRVSALDRVLTALADLGVDQAGPIVAVGGGAVADLVRTAAALWRGGTTAVCIALSPLGAVDGGVGIKHFLNVFDSTGREHKNLVRGYRPALVVLSDPERFTTVPKRHDRSGVAEMVKMLVATTPELLPLLEARAKNPRPEWWLTTDGLRLLALSTHGMLLCLWANPREGSKRREMDLGHFVGKIIERLARPAMPHGYSVSICVALISVLAAQRGHVDADGTTHPLISWEQCHRLLDLARGLKLPIWHSLLVPDVFEEAIAEVVAQRDGQQNVPAPECIGKVRWLQDITVQELIDAAAYLREYRPARRLRSRS